MERTESSLDTTALGAELPGTPPPPPNPNPLAADALASATATGTAGAMAVPTIVTMNGDGQVVDEATAGPPAASPTKALGLHEGSRTSLFMQAARRHDGHSRGTAGRVARSRNWAGLYCVCSATPTVAICFGMVC